MPYLPLDELIKQRGTPRNEDGEATPDTGTTLRQPEADASRSQ